MCVVSSCVSASPCNCFYLFILLSVRVCIFCLYLSDFLRYDYYFVLFFLSLCPITNLFYLLCSSKQLGPIIGRSYSHDSTLREYVAFLFLSFSLFSLLSLSLSFSLSFSLSLSLLLVCRGHILLYSLIS